MKPKKVNIQIYVKLYSKPIFTKFPHGYAKNLQLVFKDSIKKSMALPCEHETPAYINNSKLIIL